jgi:hypothetical protein
MSEQTYLYQDVEVRKTGRTAERTLRNNKVDNRFEITPVQKIDGVWLKWVRDVEMYKIEKEVGDE